MIPEKLDKTRKEKLMKNPWKKTSEELPPEGKYVIAKHNSGTWFDQENVNTVIVKMVRGISKSDRNRMKSGKIEDPDYEINDRIIKRSSVFCSGDEHSNNMVPYHFDTFGPSSFFGQSITEWMEIPKLLL